MYIVYTIYNIVKISFYTLFNIFSYGYIYEYSHISRLINCTIFLTKKHKHIHTYVCMCMQVYVYAYTHTNT